MPAHQDPLFSSWRLYQWARNLSGQWPGGLFDGNIFAPARDVLLYLGRDSAAGGARRAVPVAGRAGGEGLRDAGLAVVPRRRPGDVRLRARADRQPVRRVRRRGDLHGGALSHRARDAPRAAVDGVAAAGRPRHGAAAARPGRRRPARRERAGRPVPVVHLLRRVHDHALAAAGRPRVGPHAAAAVAPAGRHLGRVDARRGGRRRRLRDPVPAGPGRGRRSRGLRDRQVRRHDRELPGATRRRTGCWDGRRRPTIPSCGWRRG